MRTLRDRIRHTILFVFNLIGVGVGPTIVGIDGHHAVGGAVGALALLGSKEDNW